MLEEAAEDGVAVARGRILAARDGAWETVVERSLRKLEYKVGNLMVRGGERWEMEGDDRGVEVAKVLTDTKGAVAMVAAGREKVRSNVLLFGVLCL